jgi:hypothetical protein
MQRSLSIADADSGGWYLPRRSGRASVENIWYKQKMPDVDLVNRHPALQSMCSKD